MSLIKIFSVQLSDVIFFFNKILGNKLRLLLIFSIIEIID